MQAQIFAQNIPAQHGLPHMAFPYGYYAPPSGYPAAPGWYTQPPLPNVNLMPAPPQVQPVAAPAPALNVTVQCPKITDWLKYCDEHPDWRGEDFSEHPGQPKFDREGFCRINQLTGSRISVKKLSEWLGIGKGTADLLIQYAEEDMERMKVGTASMVLVDVGDLGGH
jgi:hypothetical protein